MVTPTAQNRESEPLTLGMKAVCKNCGEPIYTTNFALGIGWDHTNRSQLTGTQCRIFAAPRADSVVAK